MIDFNTLLEIINDTRKLIKNMTFDEAYSMLDGFNKDENLFDYKCYLSDGYDIIGTIENDNGKPIMSSDCLYEVWDDHYQILSMTEDEIKEQVDRLK